MTDSVHPDLTSLTVELLSAFVANNTVASDELAELIRTTHAALGAINAPAPAEEPSPAPAPAVSVRKSLASRDHILSLIDGRPYKTLRRHLASHGLTPDDYRARYNLPRDYPMVAPAYADQRREIADRVGLGRRPAAAVDTSAETAPAPTAAEESAPAKPGRKPRKAKAAAAPAPQESPAATADKAEPKRKPRRRLSVKFGDEAATEAPAPAPRPAKRTRRSKPS